MTEPNGKYTKWVACWGNATSITDRRDAIKTAALMAKPGDVILIAGKGHEDYQIVKGVKHHFDDKEEISRAFGL